ncbi:MAG: LptF/LptG family permease, partial [Myxococcales bacterium]|nr:LptF/LptG family permease [Myxococcales bacterium]
MQQDDVEALVVHRHRRAGHAVGAIAVAQLELVTLPVVFQQFAGMAALIGTATALAGLIRRGEVVAMFAAGGPPSLVLRPLILTALGWALVYAAVTEWVAPWSHAEMSRLRRVLGIGK